MAIFYFADKFIIEKGFDGVSYLFPILVRVFWVQRPPKINQIFLSPILFANPGRFLETGKESTCSIKLVRERIPPGGREKTDPIAKTAEKARKWPFFIKI